MCPRVTILAPSYLRHEWHRSRYDHNLTNFGSYIPFGGLFVVARVAVINPKYNTVLYSRVALA